jgi:hypothetical protein
VRRIVEGCGVRGEDGGGGGVGVRTVKGEWVEGRGLPDKLQFCKLFTSESRPQFPGGFLSLRYCF